MGYTHYWYQKEIPAERWPLIAADARKLIDAAQKDGIKLLLEYNDPRSRPQINDEIIRFNGAGGEGHETFLLVRDQDPGRRGDGFAFTKTANKPYDRVVCAILARARHHAPDYIRVSSDGDERDWHDHLAWAAKVLGEPVAFPVTADEDA